MNKSFNEWCRLQKRIRELQSYTGLDPKRFITSEELDELIELQKRQRKLEGKRQGRGR